MHSIHCLRIFHSEIVTVPHIPIVYQVSYTMSYISLEHILYLYTLLYDLVTSYTVIKHYYQKLDFDLIFFDFDTSLGVVGGSI